MPREETRHRRCSGPPDRTSRDGRRGRAGGQIQRHLIGRRRGAQRRRALGDQLPVAAAVERAIEAEVRGAGNERVDAAATGVRDTEHAPAGGRKDDIGITRLHSDGPTARPANCALPMGPCQDLPPLVLLYRPTPAVHPLPQAFGSPVPAHSVSADGSLGSSMISATLLCSNVCDWNSHVGSAASASGVIHTPPLALASQSGSCPRRSWDRWRRNGTAAEVVGPRVVDRAIPERIVCTLAVDGPGGSTRRRQRPAALSVPASRHAHRQRPRTGCRYPVWRAGASLARPCRPRPLRAAWPNRRERAMAANFLARPIGNFFNRPVSRAESSRHRLISRGGVAKGETRTTVHGERARAPR